MDDRNLFEQLFPPERAARVAVLYEHTEITFEELRDRSVRAAETLNAWGIITGDRVAILLNDSPEFITSFVAIISLGAIAVPINLALRREDQLFILKDCGACAGIVESDIVSIARMNTQDFSSAKRRPLNELFPVHADEDMDAFILYTSGSTGEPKGAVHRQADIFYTNETFSTEVLKLRKGDRLFSSSRLPFAYG